MPTANQSTSDFKGDHISVKMFGAKGDTSHDDAPAFQAAIDSMQVIIDATGAHGSGGVIEIPRSEGYYLLESDLLIKGGSIKFKGHGLYSKVLRNSATGYVFDVDPGQSDPLPISFSSGSAVITMTGTGAAVNILKIYAGLYVRLSGSPPSPFSAARGSYYYVRSVDIPNKQFTLNAQELAVSAIVAAASGTASLLYAGASYCEFEDFFINGFDQSTGTRTGGAAIRMQSIGDYRISGITIQHCWNGIELRNAASGVIRNVNHNNYAPNNVPQVTGGGMNIGVLVTENSVATHLQNIVHTARGAGVVSEAGIMLDKGTDTVSIVTGGAEHCRYGLRICNNGTPDTTSGSPNHEHDPRWVRVNDFYTEADDATGVGISVEAGLDIDISDPYVARGLYGVHFAGPRPGLSPFKGVRLSGGCVILAQKEGILIESVGDLVVDGTRVSHNGQLAANTYAGIAAGNATDFRLLNIRSGNFLNSDTSLPGLFPTQKYGIAVFNPCDDFAILDADLRINSTAEFLDTTAGSANKQITILKGGIEAHANERAIGALDATGAAIPLIKLAADNTVSIGTLAAPATNGHVLLTVNGVEVARMVPGGRMVFGTSTDDGVNILQVTGDVKVTGNVNVSALYKVAGVQVVGARQGDIGAAAGATAGAATATYGTNERDLINALLATVANFSGVLGNTRTVFQAHGLTA